MTKWFLEFFLNMRAMEKQTNEDGVKWTFGLVAEVTEKSWIIWVLRRMREAVEEKVIRGIKLLPLLIFHYHSPNDGSSCKQGLNASQDLSCLLTGCRRRI